MQSKAPSATEVPLHELLADVLAGDPAAGGFAVEYQPIVRLASRATVAVEALACWRHPDAGAIEPSQFMAAAEQTGLTGVLDDFVLDKACASADALTTAYGLDVPVHVNVSARRLARPDLFAVIDWALGRYKLAASRLVVEFACTSRIEDIGVAARAIQRIRGRGVRVCIDDFGSGYDIMTQLQGLPIDLIKLDARITGAEVVLQVCQRIGMSVVAQGITTAGQALALQEMGCQLGQGELYGPPLRLQRERKIGSRAPKNG
jgi:EAL domain-containing protein (putative c-di-GMP-specific phosphodiesterase class I)